MITDIFTSRYTILIFKDIEKILEENNIYILQDYNYLNRKGEGRFMITARTINDYNKGINIISKMIGEYIRNQKLIKKYNPKAPPPLNIII